jgi:hypothetical protein
MIRVPVGAGRSLNSAAVNRLEVARAAAHGKVLARLQSRVRLDHGADVFCVRPGLPPVLTIPTGCGAIADRRWLDSEISLRNRAHLEAELLD